MLSTILQLTLFGVMKHIQSRGEVSMFSYCCPEMPRASLMHAVVSFSLFFFVICPGLIPRNEMKEWEKRRTEDQNEIPLPLSRLV